MVVPERTLASLNRYVNDRVKPGGFLYAVLTNNLHESFGRADRENRAALHDLVRYCHNELPSHCWGSVEKVEAYLSEDADDQYEETYSMTGLSNNY